MIPNRNKKLEYLKVKNNYLKVKKYLYLKVKKEQVP